jgi:hypothetical protein
MLKRLSIVFSLVAATLLQACYGNNKVAEVETKGRRYLVTVSGTGPASAHDPISVIFGPFRVYTRTFDFPRIEGVVRGEEITPRANDEKYIGTVNFVENSMEMDLSIYYPATGYVSKTAWNGRYELKMK